MYLVFVVDKFSDENIANILKVEKGKYLGSLN